MSQPNVVHLAGMEVFEGRCAHSGQRFQILLLGDIHRFYGESMRESRSRGDVHLGELLDQLVRCTRDSGEQSSQQQQLALILEDYVGALPPADSSGTWRTKCREGLECSLAITEDVLGRPQTADQKVRVLQADRRREFGIISPRLLYSLPSAAIRELVRETISVLTDFTRLPVDHISRADSQLISMQLKDYLPLAARRWMSVPFLVDHFVWWATGFRATMEQALKNVRRSELVGLLLSETKPLLDFEIIYLVDRLLREACGGTSTSPKSGCLRIVIHVGLFHLPHLTDLLEQLCTQSTHLQGQRMMIPYQPRIGYMTSEQLQSLREQLSHEQLRHLVAFIPLQFWESIISSGCRG